ncbi:MAG TPA: hypothetical protein VIZ86_16510 [Pseudomonas sp.]
MTAAEKKPEDKSLIAIPTKESAMAVFSTDGGTAPFVAQIREAATAEVHDVTTRKGRTAIASMAARVARSKVALDDVGKQLVADLKELPKKIDAERKRMREDLDALRDEVRAPLDQWEAAEKNRIAGLECGIDGLRGLGEGLGELAAEELRQRIHAAEAITVDSSWEEYEDEAGRVQVKTLFSLHDALQAREKYEAEQAELAKLRAEKAARDRQDEQDRIAREAAERATREAEQRAQAERDAAAKREADAKAAAEHRELELKLQAERADREKLEAQQRADRAEQQAAERAEQAAAAERQRIADEQAEQQAEAARRAADREHKGNVLRAAKEAVMRAGITEDQAREVVKLIAAGQVPNVAITY